ncbi:phage baseplate protein [Psychrobacter sp. T6-6]|uniref:phage baseplate protein n=1 Tax=Psychrobacter sp. T6-6 TaxID=3457452 RepID=UPI003FD12DC2
MSNLSLTPRWNPDINQVDINEPILGGDGGNANQATRQLGENVLWLRELIEKLEPIKVNDIYTTTINHANAAAVAAHHGYGEWERYAEGRTLVGFSTKSSDPDDYKTMGNEFGENKHQLTKEEMASHKHPMMLQTNPDGDLQNPVDVDSSVKGEFSTINFSGDEIMKEVGGDEPHNNIQPSRVVGHWLRTA